MPGDSVGQGGDDGAIKGTPTVQGQVAARIGEQPGEWIGLYKLLEVIGEGGFGVVWLAERREPIVQRVALKILNPGMDTREVLGRFEQERQALAVMNHPNVAKVFDAGATTTGRPFFAMEHVPGESITNYCDRNRLSIRERLELFIPVCEAVQHAHHKGIIHRDIKPSNILVAVHEGRAAPKVIDFGVAKAVSHTLTQRTVFTEHGRLIGTPEYMSPEQAEMGATDVDTRTDVYALGVVLYELLSGLLPFDSQTLRGAGVNAICRIIREEEPPRPSTRLTTADAAASAAAAARRHTQRDHLAKELRRELDWIPLKAIRKERGERYDTPMSLAQDIARYLKGEPLEAGPQSAAYRLVKFLRKYRLPSAAALVFLILAIAVLLSMWQAKILELRLVDTRSREQITAARNAAEQQRLSEEAIKERQHAESESYLRNIMAGAASLEGGDPGRTRERLDASPEPLRSWEWRYLNAAADTSMLHVDASGLRFQDAAFSPDGRRIVGRLSQGMSGEGDDPPETPPVEQTWDLDSGRRTAPVTGDTQPPIPVNTPWIGGPARTTITVNMEGKQSVLVIDADDPSGTGTFEFAPATQKAFTLGPLGGAPRIYDLRVPGSSRMIGERTDFVRARFSPNGRRLVGIDTSGQVVVWDAELGTKVSSHPSLGSEVCDAAFSRDGKLVIACSPDGPAVVFEADTGHAVSTLTLPKSEGERHARLNERGTRIAVWPVQSELVVYDALSGAVIARRPALWWRHEISDIDFLPGTEKLAMVGDNALVWDYARLSDTYLHRGACRSLAVASDASTLTTIAADKVLQFDLTKDDAVRTTAFTPPPLACASDGRTLIVQQVSADCAVGVGWRTKAAAEAWVVCEGKVASTTDSPLGAFSVVVDRRGRRGRLLAWDQAKTIREWAVEAYIQDVAQDNTEATSLESLGCVIPILNAGALSIVSFSGDGRVVGCICDEGSSIELVDLTSGKVCLKAQTGQSKARTIALSPHGLRFATAHDDGAIRIWAAPTGQIERSLSSPRGTVVRLEVSDSGERVVSVQNDGSFWALQGGTRSLPNQLRGHLFSSDEIRFAPDETKVLAVSTSVYNEHSQLSVWDLTKAGDSRRVDPDPGRTRVVQYSEFSPDGQVLVYQRPDLSLIFYEISRARTVATVSDVPNLVHQTAARISPDSSRILVPTQTAATIFSTSDGSTQSVIDWRDDAVATATWSPDSRLIAGTDRFGDHIVLFDSKTKSRVASIAGDFVAEPNGFGTRLEWSPKGSFLRCWNGSQMRMFAVRHNSLTRYLDSEKLGHFKFLPNEESVATFDGLRRLDGSVISDFPVNRSQCLDLSVSPDGKWLWRCWGEGYENPIDAELIDLASNRVLAHYQTNHRLTDWTPDGRRALDWSDTVVMWDPLTGRDVLALTTPDGGFISTARFVQPGESLFVFTNQHLFKGFHTTAERERRRLGGP